MSSVVQQRLQPASDFQPRPSPRSKRCGSLQRGNFTVDDEFSSSREQRLMAEVSSAVDRNDPRPQHPLGVGDGVAIDPAVFGDACRKSGQRAVGLRELQPAEAGRIDCGRGIGRSRVPGERQNRAVRQVLLDLVGKSPIELPQYDADTRVEVPRKESGVEIEMIVGRKR